MQIQPINNYSKSKNSNFVNFKATYPVIYWVRESNASFAPAITTDLVKKLQNNFVRVLNGSRKTLTDMEKRIRQYVSRCDIDYRREPKVRSYYDWQGGFKNNKFESISYLISGRDANIFDSTFGYAMGSAMRQAPKVKGKAQSAELTIALKEYRHNGKGFALSKERRLYDSDGLPYSLHVKAETVRSKTGKLKGYKFIDAKFCPDSGEHNPFVKLGYIQE